MAAPSAYRGGAVLTMDASTMPPDAHEEGGPISGRITPVGRLLTLLVGAAS
ncbi:MAG TPA: hypothetical protein VK306_05720 [Acidimicrobiales bacterium]|nr:hypothetical protein [Acidimicrobiales bacterium]